MTCTAEAPVPMIATRLPVRSWSWSQRAVCMVAPAKESTPSMSGSLGTVSTPLALIRNLRGDLAARIGLHAPQ